MTNTLKDLHDEMLARKPMDASHDAARCMHCNGETASATASNGGTAVADAKTYTEDEHAAVLAQVEALRTQVADLTKAAGASELDAKLAEVKAENDAKVADLQASLDTAILEASTAKTELQETVAYLEAENAAKVEAEAAAARKDERVSKVKEVASFPDEYLEANADRFAAMSEETFEAALADWAVVSKPGKSTKDALPAATAMTASASRSNSNDDNVLAEVLGLRGAGVDVRTIS
jgi:hypothetical protein